MSVTFFVLSSHSFKYKGCTLCYNSSRNTTNIFPSSPIYHVIFIIKLANQKEEQNNELCQGNSFLRNNEPKMKNKR